jgi:hypothetical protein
MYQHRKCYGHAGANLQSRYTAGMNRATLVPAFAVRSDGIPLQSLHTLLSVVGIANVNVLNEFDTLLLIRVIYKDSFRTSQETHYVTATKINRLMLFREIVAIYCENRTEHNI